MLLLTGSQHGRMREPEPKWQNRRTLQVLHSRRHCSSLILFVPRIRDCMTVVDGLEVLVTLATKASSVGIATMNPSDDSLL